MYDKSEKFNVIIHRITSTKFIITSTSFSPRKAVPTMVTMTIESGENDDTNTGPLALVTALTIYAATSEIINPCT